MPAALHVTSRLPKAHGSGVERALPDDPFGPQARDRVGGQAQTGQDFVVVLTQRRRGGAVMAAGFAQVSIVALATFATQLRDAGALETVLDE